MSSKYVQHRVFPLNVSDSYKEYQNIDFRLSFPGRKMIGNSLRIEGRFNCFKTSTGTKLISTDVLSFFDNMIGANALFQDITTSTANQGNLELLTEAPRWNKMINTATATENDMGNSSNSSELKSKNLRLSNRIMMGEKFNGNNDAANPNPSNGMSFSTRPICCINSASSSDGGLPEVKYSSTGDITFSVRLARNDAVFFGSDVATAGSGVYNYTLSELSVSFSSVPDDNQPQVPITMSTILNVRQSCQSTFSNISVNVPQLSNSCSVSFLKQDKENSVNANNTQLDKPPLVSNVEYLFNDSTNKYLTFNLKTEEEILDRYLKSLSNMKVNSFGQDKIKANEAYGLGVNFNEYIDLSSNKFGLNLTSNIASTDPYIAYLYFHGQISL